MLRPTLPERENGTYSFYPKRANRPRRVPSSMPAIWSPPSTLPTWNIASKEAVKLTGTFLAKGEKKIREIRGSIRTQRAANANTATLIETSAGHLFRLRNKNPKAYRKLIRQVTL